MNAKDTLKKIAEALNIVSGEAKEIVSDVVTEVKEVATEVKETVSEVIEDVKEVTEDAKDAVLETVADIVESIGETVEDAGEAIQEAAESIDPTPEPKNSRVDDVAVYDFLPFAGGRPESVEAGNRAMIENQIRESGEDIEGHPYYNQSDVDYFDEDYDTGMAYGGSAQPQYKNVYDPYMPMAGNGMTMVNRPYQTAAEYGNEYAPYPGPYAEPMVTDSIRNSVIDSRRLIDGITDEEIERSTVRQQYGGYQEGDEVYMTGGELAQYLAGGGQVEFID